MMNTPMTREQLLSWIDQVSFVLVDTGLFLDTHPFDTEALEHFNHYQALNEKARKMYEEQYGPLFMNTTVNGGQWSWVTQPWPWEGGLR